MTAVQSRNVINSTEPHDTQRHGRRWQKPPSPVRTLMACGWLTAAEANDPRLRVDVLSRSHVVFRVVTPNGRAAIVKQAGRHASENGRSLARELYIYRLANWLTPLAQVLPAPLLIDERRQILALESLTAAQEWPVYEPGLALTAPGISAQLGTAMARWHRATKDIPLLPSLAEGVLYLPDALEIARQGRPESTQHFMRSLVADQEISQTLREGGSRYQSQCLIHGDIRCDNWLRDRKEIPAPLKVIDWEMSGAGDPAWDVGSACAETILEAIRRDASLQRGESGWPLIIEPVLRELLRAYVDAAGLLGVQGTTDWDRAVLYTITRLLHVGCELADYQVTGTDGLVETVVEQARLLLRQREQLTETLIHWAST